MKGWPAALLACAILGFPLGSSSAIAFDSKSEGHRGLASWYGAFHHGRRTASGERFDQHALTAAHRTLPFGTRLRVTHEGTGRSVVVRINDRGPHHQARALDLSRAAAQQIGLAGVGRVVFARLY
jgi:rare lipoprotein A